MTVLIVVTHLLGTGHLARAMMIGRAFVAAGHRCVIASGGLPAGHLTAPGVELVQLPPLRSDGINFTTLLTAGGTEAGADHMDTRQTILAHALHSIKPDVVITELFPFGRRVLATEFLDLIEAARAQTPRPLICSSIRDILAPPSKPAKAKATSDRVEQFYDAVLVHADPEVTPLDVSWPITPAIAAKLQYTGYVTHPDTDPETDLPGAGEILVSSGGGNVGDTLFKTSIAAAALDPTYRWRLLVGGDDPVARCELLRANAGESVTIEPLRQDFRHMLLQVRASVSMCGYNTAIDILKAGTPAVLVPFDDGGEVEQSLRATALVRQDGIETLPNAQLTPQALLNTIDAAVSAPRRTARKAGLDGAVQTVRIVEQLLGQAAL